MSYLVLSLCAAASVLMILYSLYHDIDHDAHEQERSQHRIRLELADMEIHRPYMIVDNNDVD